MKVRYSRISSAVPLPKPDITKKKPENHTFTKKKDIVPFNQRIATAAKDKNLSLAIEQWESIEENKMKPTLHTYCAMVNAFVRCGQLSRAEEFVSRMEKEIAVSSVTLEGYVITYTALLKGYFMSSAFERSHELFKKILGFGLGRVGSRTLDTYLRGCLRTGAFDQGLLAFESAATEKSEVSKVYIAKMMAIRLAVKSAFEVGNSNDPSVCVHIGCAYVRLGKLGRADEWFARGKDLLFSSAPERQFDKLQKSEMVRLCDYFMDQSLRPSAHPATLVDEYIGRFIAVSGDRKEQIQYWKALGLGRSKSDHEIEEMASGIIDSIRSLDKKTSCVILEVCSGSGEWVAREASKARETIFLASEFRFDRCVDILTRVAFQQLDNVWILCGDARELASIIPEGSVSELHVNYPEPPPVNSSRIEEEMSSDIVTRKFMADSKRMLKNETGVLKIVSDDKLYMQSVTNVVNDAWGTSVFPKSGKTLVDSYFARFFSKKAKRYSLDVPVPTSSTSID